MNMLPNSLPVRLAAIAAVTAGLLTGAFWSMTSQPAPVKPTAHAAAPADERIPTITIVGKRMSAAEKRQEDQRAAETEAQPLPQVIVIGYRTKKVTLADASMSRRTGI